MTGSAELIPFLRQVVLESHSDLVFPKPDGSMMSEEVNLEDVLRWALARAGIVLGYVHVCRRKACGYEEQTGDATERRCPTHGMRLWPKARHRPIRFHDLRHTTASLRLMAGANPAAVQRILRHSDPRITTEVCGHLLPGYLRAEIDRLAFGVSPGAEERLLAKNLAPFSSPFLPGACGALPEPLSGPAGPGDRGDSTVGAAGLEPTTPGFGGRYSIQMSYAPSGTGIRRGRRSGVFSAVWLLRKDVVEGGGAGGGG